MNYANPHFSIFYSCVFILVVFYIWAMRRRRMLMERFADRNLLGGISASVSMGRKMLKIYMMIAAVILLLLAYMRPQWGFEWQEVKRSGLDILIAIDVSKSMLSRDVKPNRLERSKFAVKDLVKKLKGDRIGLIAFSGTAFLQCPLTIDYNGFLLTLDDLNTATIPRGGTSIAAAIREAINVFSAGGAKASQDRKYKILVIITDGEEFEGDSLAAATEAAKAGIKIYCIGVGTAEGDLIPVTDGMSSGFLADRSGTIVKTRLIEEILKKIAIATGGNYVRATQSEFGLTLLYDRSISKLEKRDIESKMKKRYEERFQIFLAMALFLLLIEPLIGERKKVA